MQVQIRHRNIVACIRSLVHMSLFTSKDIIIQMAGSSYDVHIQEILGSLMIGSSIVMLSPNSIMDVEYVLMILEKKQVSYMQTVPAYLNNMLDILPKYDLLKFKTLRTIDIGGE